jgi:hypothetical protein
VGNARLPVRPGAPGGERAMTGELTPLAPAGAPLDGIEAAAAGAAAF